MRLLGLDLVECPGYKRCPRVLDSFFYIPWCACASEVYGSVCVCVCVDSYSCSKINEVQVRVSIGF